MKKKVLIFLFMFIFILTGCGSESESSVLKAFEKKINNSNSYHLTGVLEMVRNENSYLYDVDVAFEKEDKFRVSLTNQSNDHNQIILKNSDGVYVLTPSLNKSFKFQSEWPYNNSQSYLLQTILKDIKNDEERTFEKNDDGYVFTVKADYPNNKDLVKQHIYIDKDYNVTEVKIVDSSDITQMRMRIDNIDYKSTYEDNYFNLNSNIKSEEVDTTTSKTIDDIIYPMYVPANTSLTGQDIVETENGERVILTFVGVKPFMVVQENIIVSDEVETIPVYGDPLLITDTIGAMTDTSINWVSNNVEYYLVSDSLDTDELISVATSMSLLPVGK